MIFELVVLSMINVMYMFFNFIKFMTSKVKIDVFKSLILIIQYLLF